MPETDIINDLLTSNPNETATKGVVLLLRAEMKSEFKTVNQKVDQLNQKTDQLTQKTDQLAQSLEMVAQQVAFLVSKAR